jgi:hypothetical protein
MKERGGFDENEGSGERRRESSDVMAAKGVYVWKVHIVKQPGGLEGWEP